MYIISFNTTIMWRWPTFTPILQMKRLWLSEAENLSKVTQLVSGRIGTQALPRRLRRLSITTPYYLQSRHSLFYLLMEEMKTCSNNTTLTSLSY